jgi:16S rRNA (cytidine1402-2'-O)-methyltransferase
MNEQGEDGGKAGKLVLVATPIGNLGDLSPRAAEALAGADLVAAEDTRKARFLLDRIPAKPPVEAYHDHNEDRRTGPLLDRVAAGSVVAVMSDAGTPGVSDPGYRLVREAVARGLPVEAVPGPVAAVQALVLSGLPTDRFAVEGFLPRKAAARRQRLEEVADDRRTLVYYVSPHRAVADLEAMTEVFGDRPAALARELTKLHEEVWRGSLSELARRAGDGVRGEATVVVGGAPERVTPATDEQLAERVRALIATGTPKKQAITDVASAADVPKKRVYQAVLDAR